MIKVVQFGLGAMGAGMAQLVCNRPGYQLVGVVDRRPDLAGHDMGDLPGFEDAAGIRISPDAEGLLEQTKPDITLLATGSFISDIYDDLQNILRSGSNCITIAEEMAYPWRSHFFEANALDMLAKEHGVSLLGAGVNPGFVLDVLVLLLSGVCSRVESIHATRVNDLSPFGPTVMRTQGVGLSPEAFAEGIQSGEIVGHIGFRQSIDMIADSLGWTLDEIQEERFVVTVSRKGMVKKTAVSELPGPTAQLFSLARINEGDELGWVLFTTGEEQIFLATSGGNAIRFSEQEVRPMGLVAAGVNGIKLSGKDDVIGAEVVGRAVAIASMT